MQREIADAAARYQWEIDTRQRTIVGVNDYVTAEPVRIPILRMDPAGFERQVARLNRVRHERDKAAVQRSLDALRRAAEGTDNLMPFLLDAVKAYATLGEIMGALRQVFGEYVEPVIV
jgi:methylmalonyl-CoA mutase N-terminal domain/subunit